MLLSIITPYYRTLKEIKKIAEVLEPQLDNDIEWIIIDDGCSETELNKLNATILHLPFNSGGASVPRNAGLDIAQGKYIAFIDSDDMITEDYIKEIRKKIAKEPDIIYLSWKSQVHSIVMESLPPKWNCSVWCRVYKKDVIGDVRFKTYLKLAEDLIFVSNIKPKSSLSIKKQIYLYDCQRKGSLTRK
jgi:glycosyltransferase involved in cell wall biosynthesis